MMEGRIMQIEPQTRPVPDFTAMLRAVSRTFALGIENLPRTLREAITLAYLMFRVSDFLEDNATMPADRKVQLLRRWARVLDGEVDPADLVARLASDELNPDDPEAIVARQADTILLHLRRLPEEVQQIVRDEVRETSIGMARWQERGPLVVNEDDLDDYMFEVAGRVGYMLTDIFAWYAAPIRQLRDELMPLAREFGLALQTVNVIRGLRGDYERGWIFVPQSYCAQIGLNPPDLFKPENFDRAMQVVNKLADKAERHLELGLSYIKKIPRRYHRVRMFCVWPLFFAARTLAISRGTRSVLESEAKISREEVRQIILDTNRWGWSNTWLDQYYQTLRAG